MMSSLADLDCTGKVEVVETKFTWCVDNISEISKLSIIVSTTFKMTINNVRTKWKLLLVKKDEESEDDDDDDEEYLAVYLKSLNNHTIKATINFCILDASTDREVNRRTLGDKEFLPEECWGFPEFIELKLLLEKPNEYTVTGCCTIVCTITIEKFIAIERQKDQVREAEELKLSEFNKIEKLFNKKKFSDVVFVVEGKEIHVHKCLVANRSSVFEAMFTHDTSEAQNNRVEISDVSYLAIRDLLKYIYTGRVPIYLRINAKKLLMELLVAAEKYCIDDLKSECEKSLVEFLEVDNVFEYLNFSDKHNASHLKEEVMEYMVDHGKEIVALPSFKKNCSELHADVVSEVLRALVIKKRKVE